MRTFTDTQELAQDLAPSAQVPATLPIPLLTAGLQPPWLLPLGLRSGCSLCPPTRFISSPPGALPGSADFLCKGQLIKTLGSVG